MFFDDSLRFLEELENPFDYGQTLDRRCGDLPDAGDGHLLRLKDSAGMLQHATSPSRITGTAIARTTTRMIVGHRAKVSSYRIPTTRKSRRDRTVRLEDLFYRSRWISIGGWFILD